MPKVHTRGKRRTLAIPPRPRSESRARRLTAAYIGCLVNAALAVKGSPNERQLAGGTEDALGSSLQKLPSGERGWITMTQAAALFSHEEEQYAFGELDEDGKTRLAQFSAQYRSMPDFRPTEGRMYFKKS